MQKPISYYLEKIRFTIGLNGLQYFDKIVNLNKL